MLLDANVLYRKQTFRAGAKKGGGGCRGVAALEAKALVYPQENSMKMATTNNSKALFFPLRGIMDAWARTMHRPDNNDDDGRATSDGAILLSSHKIVTDSFLKV